MWLGCFTDVLRAYQNILSKFVKCRNCTSCDNFKLKLCTCGQSHALGTCTKFQLVILTTNVISGMVYFLEIILESPQNVHETSPGLKLIFSGTEVLYWWWHATEVFDSLSVMKMIRLEVLYVSNFRVISVWQASLENKKTYIDGLVQNCSNSSALAMELLQSCAKPSICLCSSLAGRNTGYIYFLTYLDVMTWKHFVGYWPFAWWRYQMETCSTKLAISVGNSPVPTQRPVTRNFDVFFDLRLNKRLSKQP